MYAGEAYTKNVNGVIVATPFDADKLRRQGHDVVGRSFVLSLTISGETFAGPNQNFIICQALTVT